MILRPTQREETGCVQVEQTLAFTMKRAAYGGVYSVISLTPSRGSGGCGMGTAGLAEAGRGRLFAFRPLCRNRIGPFSSLPACSRRRERKATPKGFSILDTQPEVSDSPPATSCSCSQTYRDEHWLCVRPRQPVLMMCLRSQAGRTSALSVPPDPEKRQSLTTSRFEIQQKGS